ncbi:MAG: hypothetical protein HUK26_08795, partial [Duodenibacillus sp.]|nr:hypothetical protein [Duodenibacillus sp.]
EAVRDDGCWALVSGAGMDAAGARGLWDLLARVQRIYRVREDPGMAFFAWESRWSELSVRGHMLIALVKAGYDRFLLGRIAAVRAGLGEAGGEPGRDIAREKALAEWLDGLAADAPDGGDIIHWLARDWPSEEQLISRDGPRAPVSRTVGFARLLLEKLGVRPGGR